MFKPVALLLSAALISTGLLVGLGSAGASTAKPSPAVLGDPGPAPTASPLVHNCC